MISDAIYQRITGEKGYFDTRIVFISERGPALARKKRLAIMDEDGANPKYLTNGDYHGADAALQSDGADHRLYVVCFRQAARLSVRYRTGRQEMLGDFPDMTFSPRFSPDGNKVAMTLEKNGNSDIYVMDLRTRAMTRLTTDPAIDTAPSFSPDGSKIAFESDRGGVAADLCDECRRLGPAPDQLRARPERHAGLEPAWRSDRVFQSVGRTLSMSASCIRTEAARESSPMAGKTKARPGRRMAAC